MGIKTASIHFPTDEPEKILPLLKKQFEKKNKKNMLSLTEQKEISSISANIMSRLKDEDSMSPEVQKAAADMIGYLNALSQGEEYVRDPAVVLVQKQAVSIYWDDHLDDGSFGDVAARYAKNMKVPALGVSIYDDDNFSVLAACSKEICKGSYWFDHEDIRPVDIEKFCSLLGWEARLSSLQEVFSLQDGEVMAQAFEQVSGLSLYESSESLLESDLPVIERWQKAVVLRAPDN